VGGLIAGSIGPANRVHRYARQTFAVTYQGSIAQEFQRRRLATWRAVRWWLLTAAIALVGMVRIAAGTFDATTTEVGSLLLLLVSLCLAITYCRVRKLYRCPRCNEVPTRTAFGWRDEFGREAKDVQWNPAECPACHASLREE
jgi:hypothetical protein